MYTYPDVVAVCEDAQLEDAHLDTLLNPTVLIEVLSRSTEAYDRGEKAEHYRRLPSLAEYLLVSQDKPHLEHYLRQPDNRWLLSEISDMHALVSLPAIACTLALAAVYDRVFSASSARYPTSVQHRFEHSDDSRDVLVRHIVYELHRPRP